MIKEFKAGHWYTYNGEKGCLWNSEGQMDFMLDRKPHLCTREDGPSASFEDQNGTRYEGYRFTWDNLFDFFEMKGEYWCGGNIFDEETDEHWCGENLVHKHVFTKRYVGMAVYSPIYGKGVIIDFFENTAFPVIVHFGEIKVCFDRQGYELETHAMPTLSFTPWEMPDNWNIPPVIKPNLKVDDLIMVSRKKDGKYIPQYFKEWHGDNAVCFFDGKTSITQEDIAEWKYWKPYEC